MNVQRALTLSGFGLNHLVFSKLSWKYTPLTWESWLMFSPNKKEAVLRNALDNAPTPVLFMGLSIGAFLAHDTVLKCLSHPNLQGAVFFSIAKSFIKAPGNPSSKHLASPLAYNPHGNAIAPLRAMVQQLTYQQTATPQFNEHIEKNVMPLLVNFIAAGTSEVERNRISSEASKQLILSPDKKRLESLLSGLEYLMNITIPVPKTPPPAPPLKPIVIFQGTADNILHHKGVEAFAAEMNYSYEPLPEAGHFTPFTQTQAIERTIDAL